MDDDLIPTSIDELTACVHPLLVSDDTLPEFPYWNIGTGFLVWFDDQLYLITARHCFDNHRADPTEICIPGGVASSDFIPFDRVHRGNADGAEDADFADYLIMRAKPGALSREQIKALHPFVIGSQRIIRPDNPMITSLVVRGYPRVLNDFDYEAKKIFRKAFLFDGKYAGKSSSQHCHKLECKLHPEVPDPDQLSGSPVFGFVKYKDGLTGKLVGMVIRGGAGSELFHFLSGQVLWSALNEVRRKTRSYKMTRNIESALRSALLR